MRITHNPISKTVELDRTDKAMHLITKKIEK